MDSQNKNQTQHNVPKNEVRKSYAVLAMVLTATVGVLVIFIATFLL